MWLPSMLAMVTYKRWNQNDNTLVMLCAFMKVLRMYEKKKSKWKHTGHTFYIQRHTQNVQKIKSKWKRIEHVSCTYIDVQKTYKECTNENTLVILSTSIDVNKTYIRWNQNYSTLVVFCTFMDVQKTNKRRTPNKNKLVKLQWHTLMYKECPNDNKLAQ